MTTIRVALADDIPRITEIARRAYAPYVERIGREPAPMVQDFAEALALHRLWVALDDDTITGYVVAYQNGSSFHLENVAVHPDCAGQGMGRALIDHVEALAENAGHQTVDLYTNIHMTENLSLYPRLGYKEIARRVENGFARVYFEKRLS